MGISTERATPTSARDVDSRALLKAIVRPIERTSNGGPRDRRRRNSPHHRGDAGRSLPQPTHISGKPVADATQSPPVADAPGSPKARGPRLELVLCSRLPYDSPLGPCGAACRENGRVLAPCLCASAAGGLRGGDGCCPPRPLSHRLPVARPSP